MLRGLEFLRALLILSQNLKTAAASRMTGGSFRDSGRSLDPFVYFFILQNLEVVGNNEIMIFFCHRERAREI